MFETRIAKLTSCCNACDVMHDAIGARVILQISKVTNVELACWHAGMLKASYNTSM
jgi:hypothetical protein